MRLLSAGPAMTTLIPMNVRVTREFMAEFDAEAAAAGLTRSELARLKFGQEIPLPPPAEPSVTLPAPLMELADAARRLAGYDRIDDWISDVLEAQVHRALTDAQARAQALAEGEREVVVLGVQRFQAFEVKARGCKHPPQAREVRAQHTHCSLCGTSMRKL